MAVVFQHFANEAFNLYTDSQYICTALQVLETIPYIGTSNKQVKMLFQQIQEVMQQRTLSCFVGHIRAHSNLPGPLAEGNALANKLTKIVSHSITS